MKQIQLLTCYLASTSGETKSCLVKTKCPQGYSCLGMQVSHDGVMMMQMLCPSVMLYVQGRYTKQMEVGRPTTLSP